MILLIDNYDSFTYNLYQAIGQLYEDITVIRNDKLTIEQIQNMQPEIPPGLWEREALPELLYQAVLRPLPGTGQRGRV